MCDACLDFRNPIFTVQATPILLAATTGIAFAFTSSSNSYVEDKKIENNTKTKELASHSEPNCIYCHLYVIITKISKQHYILFSYKPKSQITTKYIVQIRPRYLLYLRQ